MVSLSWGLKIAKELILSLKFLQIHKYLLILDSG